MYARHVEAALAKTPPELLRGEDYDYQEVELNSDDISTNSDEISTASNVAATAQETWMRESAERQRRPRVSSGGGGGR